MKIRFVALVLWFSPIETLGGKQVGAVLDGERRVPLRVRFPSSVRDDEQEIARIPVAVCGAGDLVPLGELVTFDTSPEAAQVSRERIQRRVSVEMNVRNRDISSVVADARSAIRDKVRLPPGYVIEWGGQFENLERASRRLAVVVPLALLLIFVLLYGAFGAVRPALLIFLNVPFSDAKWRGSRCLHPQASARERPQTASRSTRGSVGSHASGPDDRAGRCAGVHSDGPGRRSRSRGAETLGHGRHRRPHDRDAAHLVRAPHHLRLVRAGA